MRKCGIAERRFRRSRLIRGTTLLELCFTVGIASILFAMVLVLTKYVNALTRIRRAQADLGQWHASLNNWFVQFGEYPCYDARKGEQSNSTLTCWPRGSYNVNLLNTASNACVNVDGRFVMFSEYIIGAPNHIDPWGNPYVYITQDEDQYDNISNTRIMYTLFSLGPDGKTVIHPPWGNGIRVNSGDERSTHDDVYFEQ